ncbi:MAG: DUF4401 domain-containing protein [Muribaculaceae bacterium]|nr:DUF4401 domain-containing protein [Muribaculaceae bacterium]
MKRFITPLPLWSLLCLVLVAIGMTGCGDDFKPVAKDDIVPFKRFLYPTASDSVIQSIERTYDAKGKLIGTHVYVFDDRDRILTDIDSLPNGKVSGFSTTYDIYGKPQLTLAGDSHPFKGKISYERDGKLSNIIYNPDSASGGYPRTEFVYTTVGDGYKVPKQRIDWRSSKIKESVTDYYYNKDTQKPVLSGIRVTQDRDVKEVTYNDDGTIQSVKISKWNKKKTNLNLMDYKWYKYEKDPLGHWIKAEVVNSKKVFKTIKREYTTPGSVLATKTAEINVKYTNDSNVGFLKNYWNSILYRFALVDAKSNAPSWVLYLLILALTGVYMWIAIRWFLANTETLDEWRPYRKGRMERLWMFNKEPYINVLILTGCLIVSFFAAMATLIAVGLLAYGILWLFKILLIVLVWVGYIALILAIIFFFENWIYAIIFGIVSGLIILNKEAIAKAGQLSVDWGFDFMNNLNFFDWTLYIFKDLWDVLLIVFVGPAVIFMAIAALLIIFMGILMGIEWLVMKIYDIRRPCPSCGSTKGFEYMVDNYHVHPVGLHPGIYGIFHQTNPDTYRQLPTMIFNGKAKLKRRCKNCKNLEKHTGKKSFGTEKHIGIVGHRSSGKTYFLYSELDLITRKTKATQTDTTPDTEIQAIADRIKKGANVQTDQRQWFKAVQLMLPRKLSPVPWHLFFYDVAGENFDTNVSRTPTALEFYKNVESIVFIIDPSMVDPLMPGISPKAKAWIKARNESEHSSPASTYSRLTSILEEHGRKLKNINFFFLLTKSDLGYLDGKTPRQYIEEELGLSETVNQATNKFKNVDFGVTTVKNLTDPKTLKEILAKLGVDI